MFQDEARFGRMVRLRRCWAPAPLRPVLSSAYQREYTYVYGAVGPKEGCFDWMFSAHMNTVQMGVFLGRVGMAHARPVRLLHQMANRCICFLFKKRIPETTYVHGRQGHRGQAQECCGYGGGD